MSERFPPRNEEERAALLRYVRETPLVYGEWRQFKRLYKAAEAGDEAALLGTLIGRLDAASLGPETSPFATAVPSGADSRAVLLQGDRAFVVANRRLDALDVSDPAHPNSLGSCACGPAEAMAAHGSRVYLGGQGVRVVDVSDPARPRQVGTLDVGTVRSLAFAEGHLFVIAGNASPSGDLRVVDVSDPARPVAVALIPLRAPRSVAVSGRLLYVAEASAGGVLSLLSPAGLRVFDISDPRRPRPLGSARAGEIDEIVVTGRYLCALQTDTRRYRGQLQLFDLSDPARPRPVARQALYGLPRGLAGIDRCFYVGGLSDFRIYTLTDTGRLREAGTLPIGGVAAMSVSGGMLAAAAGYQGVMLLDLSNPERPARLGAPPSAATLGYMKRRARRCLRSLAKADPGHFAEVAFHALVVSGKERGLLDLARQWVTAEILFGGSDRLAQARHGRGPVYTRRPTPRWRREELGSPAWDRRLDLARDLYTTAELPWETRATALKILRATHAERPPLPPEALARDLESPWAPLVIAAARDGAQQVLAGAVLEPALAAALFLASGGRLRRELAAHWRERAEDTAWDARFAARLAELAAARLQGGRLAPRVIAAAGLLAESFSGAIDQSGGFARWPALVVALLASDREPLVMLAVELAAGASPAAALAWLQACERLSESRRERVLEALVVGLRGQAIDLEAARALIFADSTWVRTAGWRLLGVLRLAPEDLTALWREILAADPGAPARQTALDSEAALATLAEARLDVADLRDRLPDLLVQAREFSSATFVHLVRALPASEIIDRVAAIPDAAWARLREALLEALADAGWRAAFWQAVWGALPSDEPGLLRRRLVEDPLLADTFLAVAAESFFEDPPAAAEPLLLRWLDAHEGELADDERLRIAVATSALPAARARGLAAARAAGIDLPLALRLLECGFPDTEAVGRELFEALPPGDERELEYALALCDSPERSVRDYGRDYVQRRETLPAEALLHHLAEHPEPIAQEFVAQAILEHPELAPGLAGFERQVLRSRDRGRRAKEIVKARLRRDGSDDVALLLALAHGRTGRDAEWALEQLARLALEGHAIDGLSVDGPAGV